MGGERGQRSLPGAGFTGSLSPGILVLSWGGRGISPHGMNQTPCQPLPSARPQPQECLAMPGDIFGCHNLASSGSRPGLPLSVIQCTGRPPLLQQRITQLRMRNCSRASLFPSSPHLRSEGDQWSPRVFFSLLFSLIRYCSH